MLIGKNSFSNPQNYSLFKTHKCNEGEKNLL